MGKNYESEFQEHNACFMFQRSQELSISNCEEESAWLSVKLGHTMVLQMSGFILSPILYVLHGLNSFMLFLANCELISLQSLVS